VVTAHFESDSIRLALKGKTRNQAIRRLLMNPRPNTALEVRVESRARDLKEEARKVIKRFGRLLVGMLSLVVFAVLMALLPSHQAAGFGGPSVTVANTPLPVTGTLNAAVTGNVNANITNATLPVSGTVAVSSLPNVNLSGNVTVGNTASNPVVMLNLETSSRTPYRSTATLACNQLGCGPAALTVPPPGFRLVITEVSAVLPPTSGPAPSVSMLGLSGSLGALFVGGSITQDGSVVINQQVNYVLDPSDTAPTISSQNDFGTGGGVGQVTLTGYMINCSLVNCIPVQH
jgi:hypothetical protein